MTRIGQGIGVVVLVAAVAAGLWWWRSAPAPAPDAPAAAPPVASAEPPTPVPSAALPAVRYPIGASAAQAEAATASTGPASALKQALDELLGPQAVLQWLQLDDFARRLVATVDNLPREHAAARLWPVHPTPGRFGPNETPQGAVIGAGNHARYTAFVDWIERVDSRRAVAVYRSLYPMFQSAYEDLGFPGRHFNDRLVDVIDHLLATPEPTTPLAVRLVEVKGDVPSLRPWVRFEFSDPGLQARSAGQKLLLRLGPEHQRRLKAKLAEVRSLVTQPAPGGS
ncbi:DUF3014 domain-containing protein [Rubrivivax sp. RP6-9]|uniref:DUF3014 domain-containing protein n=1 Tax=Rubrivivax sp. RP6-9 TaxID=3415750 RepID=UPI003CC5203A